MTLDINSLKELNKDQLNGEQGQKLLSQSISNNDNECTQYLIQNMSIWAIADCLFIECENRNEKVIEYLIGKISKSSLRKLLRKAIKKESLIVIEELLEKSEYLRENERVYEFIQFSCENQLNRCGEFNLEVLNNN